MRVTTNCPASVTGHITHIPQNFTAWWKVASLEKVVAAGFEPKPYTLMLSFGHMSLHWSHNHWPPITSFASCQWLVWMSSEMVLTSCSWVHCNCPPSFSYWHHFHSSCEVQKWTNIQNRTPPKWADHFVVATGESIWHTCTYILHNAGGLEEEGVRKDEHDQVYLSSLNTQPSCFPLQSPRKARRRGKKKAERED